MLILPPLPPRVIPCLLLQDGAFVKTKNFKKPIYIGDPINTINLFNKFEVDEIIVMDISSARYNTQPNFDFIEELASECWVPLSYGGGISSVDDAKKILNSGIEKIIIDRLLFSNPQEVKKCVEEFGASSVVAAVSIKRTWLGRYEIRTQAGQTKVAMTLPQLISYIQDLGVGELVINDISRDGTSLGYDLKLVELISKPMSIPVVALGGAADTADFKAAIASGASAVSAGTYFVFQKKRLSGILIHYPDRTELESLFI